MHIMNSKSMAVWLILKWDYYNNYFEIIEILIKI